MDSCVFCYVYAVQKCRISKRRSGHIRGSAHSRFVLLASQGKSRKRIALRHPRQKTPTEIKDGRYSVKPRPQICTARQGAVVIEGREPRRHCIKKIHAQRLEKMCSQWHDCK